MMVRRLLLAAAAVVMCAASASAQSSADSNAPPLRTAVDATFAPFAFPKLGGGLQGFSIDLFTEVAKRLHRGIHFDGASYSGLIPAMQAGRYDFLAAPTTVTKERAENMLFTEGYIWTEYQFGIKRGDAPIKSLADLKGKAIAVNKGSAYDAWAQQNAANYGFTYQAYPSQPDCVQAVMSGRAYATLAGNAVIKYAATKERQFVPDLVLTDTRAQWSPPFRKDEVQLRNQVEDAIECMKHDGTLAKISEKWFGVAPGPDDLERVIEPGYGVPGMPGYDPTPHPLHCS